MTSNFRNDITGVIICCNGFSCTNNYNFRGKKAKKRTLPFLSPLLSPLSLTDTGETTQQRGMIE